MVEFGILSSLFDFLTFAALIGLFAVGPEAFRTAWFVESLLTELLIALVVRTQRPFFRSRPGKLLLMSTVSLVALALAIPYLPYTSLLGFEALSPAVLAVVLGITGMYVVVTELAKARLYRRAQS
jgi:Mg2+-importing ATPase